MKERVQKKGNSERKFGMMSNADILEAIRNKEMVIAGFDERNPDERLTPAGFNFSFTKLIVSVNNRKPFSIQSESGLYGEEKFYIVLEPGDTALALTRESIWVSNRIAGTFHSKVGYVSKGLGHVSTTLDPGWSGPLLISVNNPNQRNIRVYIGKKINKDDEEIQYETFITLCLHRLITEADVTLNDNTRARLELLQEFWNEDNAVSKLNHKLELCSKDLNLNESFKVKDIDGKRMRSDLNLFLRKHEEFLNELDAFCDKNEIISGELKTYNLPS